MWKISIMTLTEKHGVKMLRDNSESLKVVLLDGFEKKKKQYEILTQVAKYSWVAVNTPGRLVHVKSMCVKHLYVHSLMEFWDTVEHSSDLSLLFSRHFCRISNA